ncbi:MAG: TfoX/Sxy family protein [Boseongicola sp.]
MAYDEGLAELLRNEVADMGAITEKKMFGGLCFMLDGHMLCGVHTDGGMMRVGKDRQDKALAIDGASPMAFTGRPMGGMVDVTDEVLADDERRGQLLALALENVRSLPPK